MGITLRKWCRASSLFDGQWREPLKGDVLLLLVVTVLVFFGLLMVYSSSFIFAQERTGDGYAFIKKQVVFALMGGIGLYVAQMIPHRQWSKWGVPLLFGITSLLLFVLIPGVGVRVGGAQRWVRLGFFQLQPAEIAKFILIIFVARQLDKKKDRVEKFTAGILASVMWIAPALVLLLMQPDFGSVVMVSVVAFTLLYVGGAKARYLFGSAAAAVAAAVVIIFSSPYRHARVLAYVDPWKDPAGKGFQILQSLVGLSNGKFTGVGLGNGKEKLFYLPEAHNDFIFAVIGEELGFLGVCLVSLAFSFFVYRGLRIGWVALNERNDRFGFLLATGISLMIGLQAFVNMAVVLGLLPTKGLSLPFISYGGSALLVDLFAVGILLSVSKKPSVSNAA